MFFTKYIQLYTHIQLALFLPCSLFTHQNKWSLIMNHRRGNGSSSKKREQGRRFLAFFSVEQARERERILKSKAKRKTGNISPINDEVKAATKLYELCERLAKKEKWKRKNEELYDWSDWAPLKRLRRRTHIHSPGSNSIYECMHTWPQNIKPPAPAAFRFHLRLINQFTASIAAAIFPSAAIQMNSIWTRAAAAKRQWQPKPGK